MTRQKTVFTILLVAVVAVAGIYFTFSGSRSATETAVPSEQLSQIEPAAESPAAETQAAESIPSAPVTATAGEAAAVDVGAALAERSMGSPEAPVVIEEFASLSCGHCAHFHADVLPKLKEAYVDTGKVRFIFTDFPLNAPAMDGSMIARCMPQDQYFKFLGFLFENQEQWAFSADYQSKLRQNAKLLGTGDALFDACLASEELKQGLVARMQKASSDYDIQSTPSFVVNGKEVIRGAQGFEAFKTIIDKVLAESNAAE